VTADRTGRIVLLNGTSSSGKTTLVRALQAILPEPWLEIGIDRFVFSLPKQYLDQPLWSEVFRYVRLDGAVDGPFRIETGPLGRRLVLGMHATAAALAGQGLNVIVDHVLLEDDWLADCRTRWAAFDVLVVGVRCPLEVVIERERSRKDRTIGQAEAQFHVVHRHRGYDLELDTSALSPEEGATLIATALDARSVTGANAS
jgi:chloramphenicol 3-O phosphotransferase